MGDCIDGICNTPMFNATSHEGYYNASTTLAYDGWTAGTQPLQISPLNIGASENTSLIDHLK